MSDSVSPSKSNAVSLPTFETIVRRSVREIIPFGIAAGVGTLVGASSRCGAYIYSKLFGKETASIGIIDGIIGAEIIHVAFRLTLLAKNALERQYPSVQNASFEKKTILMSASNIILIIGGFKAWSYLDAMYSN